ncbi:hypothetical protein OEZ81_26185, partial [Leclercia adecarboxylata]
VIDARLTFWLSTRRSGGALPLDPTGELETPASSGIEYGGFGDEETLEPGQQFRRQGVSWQTGDFQLGMERLFLGLEVGKHREALAVVLWFQSLTFLLSDQLGKLALLLLFGSLMVK